MNLRSVLHRAPSLPALLVAAALHPGPATAAPAADRATSRFAASCPVQPVVLVETRPIGTKLGNPALIETIDSWINQIGSAEKSVDLEHFYLSTWPGEPSEEVLAALGEAVRRGVKVRLILDARMYRTYPRTADSLAKVPGFAVRLVDFGRIAGGVQHAKYFLVDRQVVLLGSQNFDWRALEHIHELGVRIRDARVAADFQQVFDLDWEAATPLGQPADTTRSFHAEQHVHDPARLPYRIVQAPGDTLLLWPGWSPKRFVPDTTLWDRDLLVRMLDGARHEIVLQSLNYSPGDRSGRDPALDDALRGAAARGVRVRMIISDWQTGSPSLRQLQALARVPGIEVKLSTVPEWSGGYIPFARVEHCKYAVVDTTWAWVGTSNWEPGYFHASRNLSVTMKNRNLAEQAREVFRVSWEAPGAAPLDPDATYPAKIHGEDPPPGRRKYGG